MVKIIPLVEGMALASFVIGTGPVNATQIDARYCEQNKVIADNAAANAVEEQRDFIRNGKIAASAGVCTGLLFVVAGADLGLTGMVCGLVTALMATTTSKPANAEELARDAYQKARDPRCLDAFGTDAPDSVTYDTTR